MICLIEGKLSACMLSSSKTEIKEARRKLGPKLKEPALPVLPIENTEIKEPRKNRVLKSRNLLFR